MPKRIPTPPPADDEPRYLTVVHPYAISGTCNMELPKDREDFARWVACCVDKDAFFAIFHKPSSRGMVIIEIRRDYPHFDDILGEHRWSEFLQKPTKEERGRATQVFYCTYNTGRIVQKNGWKRIDVQESWFKAWSPNNRQIKFPYPPTHFCDVPIEDRTNHPLCRPLPGTVKTPEVQAIAAPQPVVGSAAWIQTKEGGPSAASVTTQSKTNALGAWGQGAPKTQATSAKSIPTANGSVKKTANTPQVPNAGTRMPAVGGGPVVVKTSNVWQNNMVKKPPVATNWDSSAPVSRQSTPMSHTSHATAHRAPTGPPGLPARQDAWESGVTSTTVVVPGQTGSVVQRGPDGAGNFSATSWGSTDASTSSPDSDSGPDLTTATENDNPYAVHVNFSESMEEEFHGMIRIEDEEEGLKELDSIAPGVWVAPTDDAAWDMAIGWGWDDDVLDAEDHWNQNQNQETKEQILCNAHGVICKRGICAEYAKQLRSIKLAKEAEERKAASANKGKKGSRGKNRSKKNDENEDESDNNAPRINPFRGPGAPVRTNWRGTPRAIVSADAIEKRETTKVASDDGWGISDSETEANAAAVVPAGPADTVSDASWGVAENDEDPWTTAQPVTKANRSRSKPQGKKKPGQTRVSSSWADQVDAELAAGRKKDTSSTVSSKRGSSTTSWRTSNAKSSTSGWGTVADMPW